MSEENQNNKEHSHDHSNHTHPHHHVDNAKTSKKSSKKMGWLIGTGCVLVIFVLLCCMTLSILAFVLQGKNTPLGVLPVEVFQNPNDRLNAAYKSYIDTVLVQMDKTDGSFLDAKGSSIDFGFSIKTDDNKLTFDGNGNVKYDTSSKRVAGNGTFGSKIGTGTINVEVKDVKLDAVYADNIAYVKVSNLPSDLAELSKSTLGTDLVSKYDNKWIQIKPEELNSFNGAGTLPGLPQTSTPTLSKETLKAVLKEAKNYNFFKSTSLIGRETLKNDILTIHYKTDLDWDQIEKFGKYYLSKAHEDGVAKSNTDADVTEFVSKAKSNVAINSLDFYISPFDNTFYKESVDATYKLEKTSGSKSPSSLNIKSFFQVIEKDKTQSIEVPSTDLDLNDLLQENLGPSTIKGTKPLLPTPAIPSYPYLY